MPTSICLPEWCFNLQKTGFSYVTEICHILTLVTRMLWPWPWRGKVIPPLDSTYSTPYRFVGRLSRYLNWLPRCDILYHQVHSPKFDTWLPCQRIFPCPTSTRIFQEAQDVSFPKMYGRNCHPNGTGFRSGPCTI